MEDIVGPTFYFYSYFAFVSSKHSLVAKSSGETELTAENEVAGVTEWSRKALDGLGHLQGMVPMMADSTCAMQMVK
jgi:hypothetical protein